MRTNPLPRALPRALAGALILAGFGTLRAGEPDVHALSLEVQALQSLHDLELTAEQLGALAKLAEGAAMKAKAGKTVNASAAFRTALVQLRDALAKGDEEKIAQARSKYDELSEKEMIDIDDEIEVTATARQKFPQLLKMLSVHQLASYIASLDLVDPVERLMEGAEDVVGLTGKDKKDLVDDISKDVGRLVGGMGSELAKKTTKHAAEFLERASKLKEVDFKKQRAELEKEAKQVVGEVNALKVIEHEVNHNLAELLSNPRLEAAIAARMKKSASEGK